MGVLFLLAICLFSTGFSSKVKMVPFRSGASNITPVGDRQKEYCTLLSSYSSVDTEVVSIIAGLGPAGCGKTFFACRAAVKALASGDVDHIVITRPIVAVDEELGFLPGSIRDKMDPWVRPIMDVLSDFYTGGEIRRMMDDGIIEIAPLAYMRGRTFKRTYIIADEMQNSTPNQMLMMLTRIGDGSRLVITGDLMQSDLPRSDLNGLADFYKRWLRSGHINNIRCVEFEVADIQRSAAVKAVLNMYSGIPSNNDAALFPKGL